MSDVRTIFESRLPRSEAYSLINKRAMKLGLPIKITVPNERLFIERPDRHALWWIVVILGFLCYIIPGILVLIFWQPKQFADLMFEDSNEPGPKQSNIIVKYKGDMAQEFVNQSASLVM